MASRIPDHVPDEESQPFKVSFTRSLYRVRQPLSVEDYKGTISSLSNHQRLELGEAIQQEFSRLSRRPQGKHDDEAFQTLTNQFLEARRLIIPIYRLPLEILTEIFQLVLSSGRPLIELMPVCQNWYGVISEMTYVWPIYKLVLGTWTELGPTVSRSWRLDVIIDTEGDAGTRDSHDEMYSALISAAGRASRWRSLTIDSLPRGGRSDDPSFRGLFTTPMNRLEHLKVSLQSESSPFLDHLLQNITNTAARTLAVIETNSFHTLQCLTQPPFFSLFHSLTILKAKIREMSGPVDLLPHFTRLEVLEATNLLIPSYNHTIPLPLVHNLRELRLGKISVQWMGGRIFPRLKSCRIFLLPRDDTLILDCHLPACTDLRFEGQNIRSLVEMFRVPELECLMLSSNEWTPSRASQPVIDARRAGLGRHIRPRILHIALLCYEAVLLSALQLLPDLEELTLEPPRPSALGRRFFEALLAKPSNVSDQVNGNSHDQGIEQTRWRATTCPSLKVLQLRYRRWFRESDQLDVLPSLLAIGQSRAHTSFPLKAFSLYLMTPDGDWQMFELEAPAPQFLTSLGIPQLRSLPNDDQYHRSLFKAFLTSNTLSTLDLTFCNGATIHLIEPLFGPTFRHLRVLTIRGITTSPPLTVFPSFRQLVELYLVQCPIYPHDMGLPLVDTLRKLYISDSSPLWMDGRVFTKLETVIFHRLQFPKSFSQRVGMPVCSYIKMSGSLDGLTFLQSNFHFPVLDKFEMLGPVIGRDSHERALDALQMIRARALRFSFATSSPELLQLLESRDEVEELTVCLPDDGNVIEGVLIGLQATVGKPVCPNLKVLGLQLQRRRPVRGDIVKWCKQTLVNRRRAGHTLECCRIWTLLDDWQREAPLSLVMLNDGRIFVQGQVSDW